MKTVFVVLPNKLTSLDFLEKSFTSYQNTLIMRKAMEANRELVKDLSSWFEQTMNAIPPVDIESHTDPLTMETQVAFKFKVPDDVATLFNLRWK